MTLQGVAEVSIHSKVYLYLQYVLFVITIYYKNIRRVLSPTHDESVLTHLVVRPLCCGHGNDFSSFFVCPRHF